MLLVYLVEVGLILIVAPWTQFWDRNYFVEALPSLEPALTSSWLRGVVSGLGIVTLSTAVIDVFAWCGGRWARRREEAGRLDSPRRVERAQQSLGKEGYPPSSQSHSA